jgi:TRAP-type mannitol/chloroaromatic compound transport system permease small subunit
VLIWQGIDMAWDSAAKFERSSSLWNPHIWPVKIVIPVAGVLLLLQGLVRLASDARTVMGLENDPDIFGKQATDEPSH